MRTFVENLQLTARRLCEVLRASLLVKGNFAKPHDVRSPRSGDHIRRCEPPGRCGERSEADFATSFRVLPKVALLQLKLINKTKFYIMKNSNDENFNATFGNTVLN